MTAKEFAKDLTTVGTPCTDEGARDLLSFLVDIGAAKIVGTKKNEGVKHAKPANNYEVDYLAAGVVLKTLRKTLGAIIMED